MSSSPHNNNPRSTNRTSGNQGKGSTTDDNSSTGKNLTSSFVPASSSIDIACSAIQDNAFASTIAHYFSNNSNNNNANPSIVLPPALVPTPHAAPDHGSEKPQVKPPPPEPTPPTTNVAPLWPSSLGLENRRVEPASSSTTTNIDLHQAAAYANLIACVSNLQQQTAASSLQRMLYRAVASIQNNDAQSIRSPHATVATESSSLPLSSTLAQNHQLIAHSPAAATPPSGQMAAALNTAAAASPSSTAGMVLSLEQDEYELSPYQCLVRKQIELFAAPYPNHNDTNFIGIRDGGGVDILHITTQGRNRPIRPGQVGIRCRHCGNVPPTDRKGGRGRTRGAVLFPSTRLGLYQTAQNMANTHLIKFCQMIPEETRSELIAIRSREKGKKTRKSAYGGGRQYWADSLVVFGVIETADQRLHFATSPSSNNNS